MSRNINDDFKERMLQKRENFVEKTHAAFILNTSFHIWGENSLQDSDKRWLMLAYPGSTIQSGMDQGATYFTITPKF